MQANGYSLSYKPTDLPYDLKSTSSCYWLYTPLVYPPSEHKILVRQHKISLMDSEVKSYHEEHPSPGPEILQPLGLCYWPRDELCKGEAGTHYSTKAQVPITGCTYLRGTPERSDGAGEDTPFLEGEHFLSTPSRFLSLSSPLSLLAAEPWGRQEQHCTPEHTAHGTVTHGAGSHSR